MKSIGYIDNKISEKQKVMSLTARPQMRGAMQLLFSLLDFKMTNTVKMLKTRPSTVITIPPKEATRADVSLKDELVVILAIIFQD